MKMQKVLAESSYNPRVILDKFFCLELENSTIVRFGHIMRVCCIVFLANRPDIFCFLRRACECKQIHANKYEQAFYFHYSCRKTPNNAVKWNVNGQDRHGKPSRKRKTPLCTTCFNSTIFGNDRDLIFANRSRRCVRQLPMPLHW